MLPNFKSALLYVRRFSPLSPSLCPFTGRGKILLSVLLTICGVAHRAFAEFPSTQPYPGVTYSHDLHHDPDESVFVVTINLDKANIRVAPAGPDPDGPQGEWQTTLLPASEIAKRENFDVTINASFFTARDTKDAEGVKSGYVRDKWAKAVGLAMTGGKLWSSQAKDNFVSFWIDGDHRAHLGAIERVPDDAAQIVQGNAWLLRDDKPVEQTTKMMQVRHPRTAIDLDRAGKKLILLTVDGRRPGVSLGMTGDELSVELQKLGAETAINLDGGGTTTLVLRDPQTGEQKILNQPSDTRERAVADVVGVTTRKD